MRWFVRLGAFACLALASISSASAATGPWVDVTPPDIGPGDSMLGLATPDRHEAWVVGERGSSILVEHWDGASWTPQESQVPLPANAVGTRLLAVAASGSGEAWAGGGWSKPTSSLAPLLEHFQRGTWHRVPPPPQLGKDAEIWSVATGGPDDAWIFSLAKTNCFTYHWNGSAWTQAQAFVPCHGIPRQLYADAPDTVWVYGGVSEDDYYLTCLGVQCPGEPMSCPTDPYGVIGAVTGSPSDLWVSGAAGAGRSFICHWDGTSWTDLTPSPGTTHPAAFGCLAELRDGQVMAYGRTYPGRHGISHRIEARYTPGAGWEFLSNHTYPPRFAGCPVYQPGTKHTLWAPGAGVLYKTS